MTDKKSFNYKSHLAPCYIGLIQIISFFLENLRNTGPEDMKEEDEQTKISTVYILKQIHAYSFSTIKILLHFSGPGY